MLEEQFGTRHCVLGILSADESGIDSGRHDHCGKWIHKIRGCKGHFAGTRPANREDERRYANSFIFWRFTGRNRRHLGQSRSVESAAPVSVRSGAPEEH